MRVWVQWYGGPNYRTPEYDEYEEFSSIKNAKWAFWSRFNDGYFPCVDEDTAEMFVFKYDPFTVTDRYPDFSFKLGPRGGVRREVC